MLRDSEDAEVIERQRAKHLAYNNQSQNRCRVQAVFLARPSLSQRFSWFLAGSRQPGTHSVKCAC
jgi:hypothetical protein